MAEPESYGFQGITRSAMRNDLHDILSKLEDALRLELELGQRVVEFDRSLLLTTPTTTISQPQRAVNVENVMRRERSAVNDAPHAPIERPEIKETSTIYSCVFLHYRPFTGEAARIWDSIYNALSKDAQEMPLIFEPPLPKARIYIALGQKTLKKFFPDKNNSPGQKFRLNAFSQVLVTWTPEFFARYSDSSTQIWLYKKKMWESLKATVRDYAIPLVSKESKQHEKA